MPTEADFYNIEVEGDGNCFFYACWESARLQGITVLKDLALEKLQIFKEKTIKNALATDLFPVVDASKADKLQVVDELLNGLDAVLADKMHHFTELQPSNRALTLLSEVDDNPLNPLRYEQQHAFAWFMRKLLASSRQYKTALSNWKEFYETSTMDDVVRAIDEQFTPYESIQFLDETKPVREAVRDFVAAMPEAFKSNADNKLMVSGIEISALKQIFDLIGLNLNVKVNEPILTNRPTLFVIQAADHFTARVPRFSDNPRVLRANITQAMARQADAETLVWKQKNSDARSRRRSKRGGNRTKKRR